MGVVHPVFIVAVPGIIAVFLAWLFGGVSLGVALFIGACLGAGAFAATRAPRVVLSVESPAPRVETDERIVHVLSEPVLVLNAERNIEFANQAARDLFGTDLVGRDLTSCLRQPEVLQAVRNIFAEQSAEPVEITLPGQVPRYFELRIHDFPAAANARKRALLVLYDFTDTHNAAKIREDFIANVSHEMRSPLAALVGFIETLKGSARDDPEARARFLDIMSTEADRMTLLVQDLLSLSQVESHEHLTPEEPLELIPLIERVVASLSVLAEEQGHRVTVDKSPGLRPVPGDGEELTQVFHNLIGNALKYGAPDTPVEISLRPVDRVPGHTKAGIAVAVKNIGDGIAPEHIPRLTERFYRVDKGRSRRMGGTGLGLAIVKHIVNHHRGHLDVQSELGGETVFTVIFPVCESDARPEEVVINLS